MRNSLYLIASSVCLAALLVASSAQAAQGNWYLGGSGDVTWLKNSDTGGGGNIDLGYRFWPTNFGDFRLEAEAGYHGAGGDSGNGGTHYFSYMGNLYYDFDSIFPASSSGWHVVPYIGGGLGDASLHYGAGGFSTTYHHHTDEFAYQGMAGLTFASASMPNADWYLGYRYQGTDQYNIDSNSAELGIRFNF